MDKKVLLSALLTLSTSFYSHAITMGNPFFNSFEQFEKPKFENISKPKLPPIPIKKPEKKEENKKILVKFKDNAPYREIKRILDDLGIKVDRYFKFIDVFALKLPEGFPVNEAVEFFKSLGFVEFAEPDIVFKLSSKKVPNDPLFQKQWGLNNSSDTDIDAPEGWSKETGSKDIVIAVIDTGVDYRHEDLKENIWKNERECNGIKGVDDDGNGYVDDCYGWNAVSDNPDPMDDNGHGTHVSGIAAGDGNNGKGIAGVSWNSKILPLKFMDSSGRGNLSDAIECIEYIVKNIQKGVNIKVVNASWGGYQKSSSLKEAIEKLKEEDVLFVSAAGNDKNNNDEKPYYPASYRIDNIIAVAATDKDDNLASFSNYGKNSVDVAAPGVDILSTYPDNNYRYMSGTSMATPFVSGIAAVLWSENKGYSYRDIKSLIEKNGDKLVSLDGLVKTESRVNLDKALKTNEDKQEPKEADIRVKPESYDYGKVKVGSSEINRFTIYNVGEKKLLIYNIYIQENKENNFEIISNTCPSTLNPDEKCEVSVRFSPESSGTKKANLIIRTNDPDESLKEVPLKGEGVEERTGFFDLFSPLSLFRFF